MLIPLSLCLLIPMLDLLAYPDADDSNDDPDQKKSMLSMYWLGDRKLGNAYLTKTANKIINSKIFF